MIFECNEYRTFLKKVFAEKSQQREGYSLRAFAEKITVSHSFLSEVLSSKKTLSVDLAFKISLKLELNELETQYFCLMVQFELEKNPECREKIQQRLKAMNPLNNTHHHMEADVFKSISEWHYGAILELTNLVGFKMNALNISKKLGITESEAATALDRLQRLKMLTIDQYGNYKKAHDNLIIHSDVPNTAFKEHHKNLIEKAAQSLYTHTPKKDRISQSNIFALDSKYFKEINDLTLDFESRIMKLCKKSKVKDGVYATTLHCFKLSEN